MFVILMGISGCGKSTIGKLLAERLGWHFFDGDDYHSQQNIHKMAAGLPLTDADRTEWLDRLSDLIKTCHHSGENGILACSALKEKYRQKLTLGQTRFVFLKGSREVIYPRIALRKGHFMQSSLLQSQFDTLEEPSDALTIDVRLTPTEIVQLIINEISA